MTSITLQNGLTDVQPSHHQRLQMVAVHRYIPVVDRKEEAYEVGEADADHRVKHIERKRAWA